MRLWGEELLERLAKRRDGRRHNDDRLRVLRLVAELVELVLCLLLARVLLPHALAVDHDVEDVGHGRDLPAVAGCFVDDFEACIAHLRFPLRHRKVIRTTNLLERLFLEERRRTKIIPHAFGERPVLKLMYAALIRAADRWRGLTVGEFEQRQLRAILEELDRART